MRSATQTRAHGRRGQATVELALSTILFVVIIAGGIHFAELGMLSVKATEASSAALWDATGRRAHNYADDTGELESKYAKVAVDSAFRIREQYLDFDGRDRSSGTSPQLVFTRGGSIEVQCEEAGSDVFGDRKLEPHPTLQNVVFRDDDQGGIRCWASATASIIPGQTPQRVFTQEGWLKGPVLQSAVITLCGVGRAWNGGECNQGTPMLLGDWALSDRGNREHERCELNRGAGCDNSGYYRAVEKFYDRVGAKGDKGSALARGIVGYSPIREDKFWFSFRGEEDRFKERVPTPALGNRSEFIVTPGGQDYSAVPVYFEAYTQRSTCWLGMKCDDY